MKSKFELSISTSYVPDWGITEAFRELFQNALDNETINPENKMRFELDGETVRISNKTSTLTSDTLLLGHGTKHDETRTIGKHGEGYKIAFMVLLRNGKKIKVYNYGAREIWDVRLVNSKRYNGQQIPTVFIEKEAVWKNVPNNDLTIEIEGVSIDEYEELCNKNLHLRKNSVNRHEAGNGGYILLDEEEKGNIYVGGLFVTNVESFEYGYDFSPEVLKLDRDRRMVNSFDVAWNTSIMWCKASESNKEIRDRAVKLVNEGKVDTKYVNSIKAFTLSANSLVDAVAEDFYATHGEDAIPVIDNEQFDRVTRLKVGKPIITDSNKAEIIKSSSIVKKEYIVEEESLTDKFKDFLEKIKEKLTEEEVNEFEELIKQI